MKRFISILLLLSGSLFAAWGEESINDLMKRLSADFATIETVQTRFVETKNIRILDQELELTGTLAIEKPKRLAWRTETPLACTLIISDGTGRQWDEDSRSVESFSSKSNPVFSMVLDQMQNWFSGDFVSLQNDYDVVLEQKEPLVLSFRPHADSPNAQAIKTVRVTIRNDLRYVQAIRIEDTTGDTTTITFIDTILNEAVPADTWRVHRNGR